MAAWREIMDSVHGKNAHPISGPDGGPIQFAGGTPPAYDLARYTPQELAQLEALLGRGLADPQ